MNKKLLKSAIIVAAMVLVVLAMATAQVTIGGGEPPRATLDVRAMQDNTDLPQGIIPPQVTRQRLIDRAANYNSAELNGAIVFVNVLDGTLPTDGIARYVDETGHYYFYFGTGLTGTNPRAWRRLGGVEAAADVPLTRSIVIRNTTPTFIPPAIHTVVYVDVQMAQIVLPRVADGAIDGSILTFIAGFTESAPIGGSSVRFRQIMNNGLVAEIPDLITSEHVIAKHDIWSIPISAVLAGGRFQLAFVAGLGENGKWIASSLN